MVTHLHDPELLDALLKHPSITQDQQTFCALLATSQATRTLLNARCSGQLTVQLTAAGMQEEKVSHLAEWLKQHAHLVQRLELQLSDFNSLLDDEDNWSALVDAIAVSLHTANCRRPLALQHLTLAGSPISYALLTALPASSLTSLACDIPTEFQSQDSDLCEERWHREMDSISRLPQLRQLDISSSGPWEVAEEDAYTALIALRHLTRLQLGRSLVPQLQYIPYKLQQLEVHVDINASADVDEFALWFRQHGHLLMQLHVSSDTLYEGVTWAPNSASQHAFISALQQVASQAGGHLQLHDLWLHLPLGTQVYKQLHDCCNLTTLNCMHNAWSSDLLSVIGSMASLRELTLMDVSFESDQVVAGLGLDALKPLSSLTCLSKLSVGSVEPSQLQHLPSALQELVVESVELQNGSVFSLGHLSCLTKLEVPHLTACDVLPPNVVSMRIYDQPSTLQPLLQLQYLQRLTLQNCSDLPSEQLLPLSSLRSLISLHLDYSLEVVDDRHLNAQDVAAWALLPLRSLSIFVDSGIPGVVISALSALHELTELRLDGLIQMSPDGPSLIDTLPSLTNLRTLVVDGMLELTGDWSDDEDNVAMQFVEALQEAAEALPALQECHVGYETPEYY